MSQDFDPPLQISRAHKLAILVYAVAVGTGGTGFLATYLWERLR